MKSRNLSILILALSLVCMQCNNLMARVRSIQEAQKLAMQKLSANGARTANVTEEPELLLENDDMYIFGKEDQKGFVVVSTNEDMPEILGYSENGTFDPENIPDGMKFWMDYMAKANEQIKAGNATVTQLFGSASADGQKSTSPLLGDIAWDQSEPYNEKCPAINDTLCATGCAATALAQILKYYNTAVKPTGKVSYKTETRKVSVSYDFSSASFDWANMRDGYSNLSSKSVKGTMSESKSNLIYVNIVPYGSYGGIYFKVDTLISSNGAFKGEFGYILCNSSDEFLENIGGGLNVSFSDTGYGYGYCTTEVVLPNSYADGTYHLYLASRDSVSTEWKKIMKYDWETGARSNYYLTAVKKGGNFTIGNLTGYCTYTKTEANAVAELMYACGAALEMDYGTDESSASILAPFTGAPEYFGFDSDGFMVMSDYYCMDSLISIVTGEIDASHPVLIGGIAVVDDSHYGHAFIADGYKTTAAGETYFHINWGWKGSSNGDFLLSKLAPDDEGTGGSGTNAANYSDMLYIDCNYFPDDAIQHAPYLCCDSLTLDATSIDAGGKLSYNIYGLLNCGCTSLTGSLYLCFENENGEIVQKTKINAGDDSSDQNINLKSLYYYKNITGSITVPSSIASGSYKVTARAARSSGCTDLGYYSAPAQTVITVTNGTAIEKIKLDSKSKQEVVRDLMGREVQNPQQGGLYIKGNHKVVM